VIIASARRNGRTTSIPRRPTAKGRFCPSVKETKIKTPGEILAYRKPGLAAATEGLARPASCQQVSPLEIEGHLNKRGRRASTTMMRGVGAHEVIHECPQPLSTSELSEEQVREVSGVYRRPAGRPEKRPAAGLRMIFKNVGGPAGASLEHTHSH